MRHVLVFVAMLMLTVGAARAEAESALEQPETYGLLLAGVAAGAFIIVRRRP